MQNVIKGKMITITSMKGGVGKTVFTLQLAAALKKQKKKVLIVDLDLYNGDIAFALNLDVKSTIYNLCDDVTNNRYKSDLLNKYIVKYDEGVDILPSPKDPRQASKIDKRILDMVLRTFTNKYDVILIDTNHMLTVTNMVAFECSDLILDIFTNNAFDLKNTKNFVALFKNMKVDNIKLLLNYSMDDKKKYFSEQDIETIIDGKIDFILSRNYYIKNIDKLTVDNKLFETCEKTVKNNSKDVPNFLSFALDLLNNNRKGGKNEEE